MGDFEAPPDIELIERSLTGDNQAFEQLVTRYQRSLLYFTRRFVNADEAEDIVQSTWLKVYLNLNTLRSKQKFKTWLYQIARNMVVTHLRKHSRYKFDDHLEHIMDPKADIPLALIRKLEAQQVHEALGKLKPEFREVLTLQFMEDMSYEEISDICSCSVGTVKSRLFYAKKSLMEQLEGKL